MKNFLKWVFSRFTVVGLLLLLQVTLLFLAVIGFTEYFVFYWMASVLLALGLTLMIVKRKDTAEYKIAWLVTVLLFPVFGGMLYLVFSGGRLTKRSKAKMAQITEGMKKLSSQPKILSKMEETCPSAGFQSAYIANVAACPPAENTEVVYYPLGEDFYASLLTELQKAEKYIFLEYFILADGAMWQGILDILTDKVKAGVDVRLIYDDMGCMNRIPDDFPRRMAERGIRCHAFNRFVPVLSARLNNRNHRKIAVIDGVTAFTGGVNIADEYINEEIRFGHWKDNAVMLRGDAAWNMTVMFLTMWDYLDHSGVVAENYDHYRKQSLAVSAPGYVQPYTDNPLDNEPIGKTIYLNMLARAEKYVYITTPYLIIDELLETALCNAAKSGLDVRIITPGVPDKKLVHETTRSYYRHLMESGVKIYEYTPGFIHAKTFVSDDRFATVGTVNLDFRSLYLHFECGVWMHDVPAIEDIRADFIETMGKSREVAAEDFSGGFFRELFRSVLVLLAPLM